MLKNNRSPRMKVKQTTSAKLSSVPQPVFFLIEDGGAYTYFFIANLVSGRHLSEAR